MSYINYTCWGWLKLNYNIFPRRYTGGNINRIFAHAPAINNIINHEKDCEESLISAMDIDCGAEEMHARGKMQD